MKRIKFTTSWDDGDVEDMRLLALMNKYGIKGTFYIPGNCEITPKHIKEIAKTQEVGGHTMHHYELSNIALKDAKQEIVESKKFLEKITGKEITTFCYPKGMYTQQVAQEVAKAGFKYARTTKRYCFGLANNPMENGTSAQTITFRADLFKMLAITKNPFCVKYISDWQYYMEQLYNHVSKKGGVLHLWGHSWEVDELNQWEALERFFKFISSRDNVEFVTNGELVE